MNREYRRQKIQKRMSRIMVREAVAEAENKLLKSSSVVNYY